MDFIIRHYYLLHILFLFVYARICAHRKTYTCTDCGSDHLHVVCKLRFKKIWKLKKPKAEPKLQYNRILNDQNIRKTYGQRGKKDGDGNSKWVTLERSFSVISK